MSTLSDKFRSLAKTNVEGSNQALEADDFGVSPKKQALAIIGQINATIYNALADTLDEKRAPATGESSLAQTIAWNHALRLAAARGDNDEFDRLTATLQQRANAAAGIDPGSTVGSGTS